jgi:hypothetical protein
MGRGRGKGTRRSCEAISGVKRVLEGVRKRRGKGVVSEVKIMDVVNTRRISVNMQSAEMQKNRSICTHS